VESLLISTRCLGATVLAAELVAELADVVVVAAVELPVAVVVTELAVVVVAELAAVAPTTAAVLFSTAIPAAADVRTARLLAGLVLAAETGTGTEIGKGNGVEVAADVPSLLLLNLKYCCIITQQITRVSRDARLKLAY